MRVLLVLLLALSGAAEASQLAIGRQICAAVTARDRADDLAFTLPYKCDVDPAGYEHGTLWLHQTVTPAASMVPLVLLIHQTRVDRTAVLFRYTDGRVIRTVVSDGAFQDQWRIGGQLIFHPPERDAPLSDIVIRFDGLSSHELLRIRMLPAPAELREATAVAALVSGALTLLLVGLIYNLGLGLAVRRAYLAWHAAWSTAILLWGLVWSQLALFVVPGIAGTVASQLATLLAGAAVMLAATSAAVALRPVLPRALSRAILGSGLLSGMFGVAAAALTGPALRAIAPLLAVVTLVTLAVVGIGLAVALRRGSSVARDLAFAWAVPMIVLALTMLVDFGGTLGGGGAQIAVLFACAFQTLWLALAATLRFGRLRRERDAARAAELMLEEVARRDPLTGLLNRRGLRERFDRLATGAGERGMAMFLIDIDHFKTVNDRWGHDAGDLVLARVGRLLRRCEVAGHAVGRLGGEEFVILATGLSEPETRALGDMLCADLASLDHRPELGGHMVTASIGVARGDAGSRFATLYQQADRALYAAKRAGRNCVVAAADAGDSDAGDFPGQPPSMPTCSTGRAERRRRSSRARMRP